MIIYEILYLFKIYETFQCHNNFLILWNLLSFLFHLDLLHFGDLP